MTWKSLWVYYSYCDLIIHLWHTLYESFTIQEMKISLISIRYKCMTLKTTPRDCYCSFWRRPLTNNHLGKLWKTVRPVTRNRIFATTRFLRESLICRSNAQWASCKMRRNDPVIIPLHPPRSTLYVHINLIKRIPPSTCPKPPKTQRKHEQSQRVRQMHGRL